MITKQLRELGLSQTIEMVIDTNTVTKFRFSDSLSNLDNVLVHGIAIGDGSIGKSPSYRTVLSQANLYNSYLTLMGYKNEQFNYRLPFLFFTFIGFPVMFVKPKLISFRNSFVEIVDAQTLVIPVGGYSILFTVYFEKYVPSLHQLDINGELIEPED